MVMRERQSWKIVFFERLNLRIIDINSNGKIGKMIDFVRSANENSVVKSNKDLVLGSKMYKQ